MFCSIGNSENDWKFVWINNYIIEFYNYFNLLQNDFSSCLSSFYTDIDYIGVKCIYYNYEVFCNANYYTNEY